jgi:hypothetical protein
MDIAGPFFLILSYSIFVFHLWVSFSNILLLPTSQKYHYNYTFSLLSVVHSSAFRKLIGYSKVDYVGIFFMLNSLPLRLRDRPRQ